MSAVGELNKRKRELARWSQIGQLGGLIYLEALKRPDSNNWSGRELAVKALSVATDFVDEWFALEPKEGEPE